MKTLIIIFSLFAISICSPPETCYCTDNKISWTAYCGEGWTCEKCCKKTRPKPKKKKKKDE